jgi:hypothetical protein
VVVVLVVVGLEFILDRLVGSPKVPQRVAMSLAPIFSFNFVFSKQHSLPDNGIKFDKRQFMLCLGYVLPRCVEEACTSRAQQLDGHCFALGPSHCR